MAGQYIVIADDDEDDRDLFKEALSACSNLAIEEADNGADLYQKLTSQDALPAAVFLDLNMPEMGGKECLHKIRDNPSLQELPVIIYSTSSAGKDIEETFELGASLYVIKPNTFSELEKILPVVMGIDWAEHAPHSNKTNFVFRAI